MNRIGNVAQIIATEDNYHNAFVGFRKGKKRSDITRFELDLDANLRKLMRDFLEGSYQPGDYKPKEVFEPKRRIVQRTDVTNHVAQWAAVLPIERWLMDSFYFRSPSCVPKRGTHCYVHQEMRELRKYSQDELYYFVQLDIHHYFLNINHAMMKERIREKIKDALLLKFLDTFIDSYPQGLVLGVKLAQLLSGMYLAPFDRMALHCFGLDTDREKFRYWQQRYVTNCLVTCRSRSQAEELAKGVDYLNRKFERYVNEGLQHYSRFADNIVIKHRDKTFLHLMVELSLMILTRDFLLPINRSYNVRPTWMGNDICGYVFYHDHTSVRKRNKKSLCKQVKMLQRQGYDSEYIRRKCSSRIGFASHANSKHLLQSLNINMEQRLGAKIKRRRLHVPFEGMEYSQKRAIADIVCQEGESEEQKLILLLDYKIDNSVIEQGEDGNPRLRIALRYRTIDSIEQRGDEPIYHWSEQEYFTYSGSRIMIDQATSDFSREDLPSVTVIRECQNKFKKKFYKFT